MSSFDKLPAFRAFVIALMLAATVAAAQGQSPQQATCKLAVDQAPAIRGIRLGMTAEQVFALFPGSSDKTANRNAIASAAGYPNYGAARLSILRAELPEARERLAGVDWISVTLFDGRLVDITVFYAGPNSNPRGPSWPNVNDFIAKVSEAFGLLRPEDWSEVVNVRAKTLRCNGFELLASIQNGGGQLSLRDTRIRYPDTVRLRAAADEEKRRREFKP